MKVTVKIVSNFAWKSDAFSHRNCWRTREHKKWQIFTFYFLQCLYDVKLISGGLFPIVKHCKTVRRFELLFSNRITLRNNWRFVLLTEHASSTNNIVCLPERNVLHHRFVLFVELLLLPQLLVDRHLVGSRPALSRTFFVLKNGLFISFESFYSSQENIVNLFNCTEINSKFISKGRL